MKTLALAACAVAVLTASAEVKIGVVDMMSLVRNHSSYEPNKKLLSDTEKDYTRKIDGMKSDLEEIQEEGKKLSEQLRNPLLSAAAKEKLEKEMVDVQGRFVSLQQRIRGEVMRTQQELQGLEGRLLKATTEDLRRKINEFAESGGYDIIVDRTAAPYSKEALDVTPEVLKAMGVDPAKARGPKDGDEGK